MRDHAAKAPPQWADRCVLAFDRVLRATTRHKAATPAAGQARDDQSETPLSAAERRRAGALMRVNHAGEVAAQGLYAGQALVARDARLVEQLRQSAEEEEDHLRWCKERLDALDAKPSKLTPLWYGGSHAIGFAAGLAGDRWSLGFVVETERQVVAHLQRHLARLPKADRESAAVIRKMQADERRHAATASALGAVELPCAVRGLMRLTAKVMTGTAYWI